MYSYEIYRWEFDNSYNAFNVWVTRWPNYKFTFDTDGGFLGVEPQMNFRNNHTKNSIVCGVWNAFMQFLDGLEEAENLGENTMKSGKLFKVLEGEKYGTFLTFDSQGRYVLEMKNNEGIKAFTKAEVEEVRPYTVAVSFINSTNSQYHYWAKEGELEVGDLVILDGSIVEVRQIDTKSDRADKYLAGRKLSTTALTAE